MLCCPCVTLGGGLHTYDWLRKIEVLQINYLSSHDRHAAFCSSLGSPTDFLHGRVNLGRDMEDLKAKFAQ